MEIFWILFQSNTFFHQTNDGNTSLNGKREKWNFYYRSLAAKEKPLPAETVIHNKFRYP